MATKTRSSIPARPATRFICRRASALASPNNPRRHLLLRAKTKAERIKAGEAVFVNNCQACHQANGEGVANAFPPLAKSDYLNADKVRAIKTVTGGLEGKLTVNGVSFNGVMPAWELPDEDIANVMTYIYNTWGNSGLEIRPADVQANRVKPN